MTLYDDLGVKRDATADEIRKAFREKAQKAHPDKPGGSTEQFQVVQKAYAILGDPTARDRYDRTGATDEPQQQNIHHILAGLVLQAIETLQSPEHDDVFDAVRQRLNQQIEHTKEFRMQSGKKIEKHGKVLARIKKKSGENLVAQFIQHAMNKLKRGIAAAEADMELSKKLLAELDEYTYTTEPRSSIFTSSTSASGANQGVFGAYRFGP